MASPQISDYQLSFEILGHSADVRAVQALNVGLFSTNEHIVTASRDGTACVWAPEAGSKREYILKKVFKQHTGYVSSVCVIPSGSGIAGRSEPLIATGGQDMTILIHSMDEGVLEPVGRFTGHTALITRIIVMDGLLISSSWDSTIRIWRGPSQSDVLTAHKPAVWAIAALFEFDGTRRILSGGADRTVNLWEVDTKLCVQQYVGHGDVVRDIQVTSSDTFLSAANDCIIREWNIHSGQCLRDVYGHEAFVYGISLLPGREKGNFISCGEDSTLRVWKGYECNQVIHIPATSVWCVCCMNNGDIIAGSSDGVARVFTTSSERKAPTEELLMYEEKVEQHKRSSSKSGIDVSKLPERDALLVPGRSNGDTKMINNNGTAEVYQWNVEQAEWIKIGDAIGKAPSKNVYNNEEFDYVFDIELDEGGPTKRKLKLPYNKEMDPFVAAENFLSANDLPAHYLDEVAEFIIKNAGNYSGPTNTMAADPFTGASRYVPGSSGAQSSNQRSGTSDPFTGAGRYQPETWSSGPSSTGPGSNLGGGADPFTGSSSYRPSEPAAPQFNVTFKGGSARNSFFPISDFKLFTSPQDYGEKVIAKITEFNEAVDQKLTASQLTRLKGKSVVLELSQVGMDSVMYLMAIFLYLQAAIPLTGLCSILTTAGGGSPSREDLQLVQTLLRWPSQYSFPGLDLLRLALLSENGLKLFFGDPDNGKVFLGELFAFAVGAGAEAKNQLLVMRSLANVFSKGCGVQFMLDEQTWVISQLHDLLGTSNRTVQIALATIVLNYCHYYSIMRRKEGFADCIHIGIKILTSTFDSEAKFRILIGIGSLALLDKSVVLSSTEPGLLSSVITPLCDIKDPAKVSECAKCVLQAIR